MILSRKLLLIMMMILRYVGKSTSTSLGASNLVEDIRVAKAKVDKFFTKVLRTKIFCESAKIFT